MSLVVLAAVWCAGDCAAAQPPGDACVSLAGQPIRWIVPSRPGGGYDAYSRLMQPFLEQRLDVRIIMENRPEAGGIVAALAIRDAEADGKTLGIINTPGLMTASMVGDGTAPDPTRDLTVLGRVMDIQYVVFTGRDSGISSASELLSIARERPILVGVRDSGSSSFFSVPVTASLLGFEYALVTGYVGNAARTLAAIRGEVDIVVHNFDSAKRYVNSGELIPLLQVTGRPISQDGMVPGLESLARQQAGVSGITPEQAEHDAAALNDIVSTGRLIVAPRKLSEPLTACLAAALTDVLQSDEFLAAARRAGLSIAALDRESAQKNLDRAALEMPRFAPMLRAALDQARQ